MATHSAQRRLVKSRPELWAEISDQQSLARRLEAFGEIRITGTDPETTVAWEGTAASGTVKIESAGWGTKVVLTVELADTPAAIEPKPEPVAQEVLPTEPKPEPVAQAAPEPAAAAPKPEPVAQAAPEPAATAPKKGLFARWFGFGPPIPDPARPETTTESVAAPAPAPTPEPEPAPAPPPLTPPEVEPTVIAEPAGATMPDGHSVDDFLSAVLDDLGAAHHRPFSRS